MTSCSRNRVRSLHNTRGRDSSSCVTDLDRGLAVFFRGLSDYGRGCRIHGHPPLPVFLLLRRRLSPHSWRRSVPFSKTGVLSTRDAVDCRLVVISSLHESSKACLPTRGFHFGRIFDDCFAFMRQETPPANECFFSPVIDEHRRRVRILDMHCNQTRKVSTVRTIVARHDV